MIEGVGCVGDGSEFRVQGARCRVEDHRVGLRQVENPFH